MKVVIAAFNQAGEGPSWSHLQSSFEALATTQILYIYIQCVLVRSYTDGRQTYHYVADSAGFRHI